MSENIEDLSDYKWLSECPDWWQNFISHTVPDPDIIDNVIVEVEKKLLLHNGKVYVRRDASNPGIQRIVFDSSEDQEFFKIYWTLRGKREGYGLE
jgi:hypothetical protein